MLRGKTAIWTVMLLLIPAPSYAATIAWTHWTSDVLTVGTTFGSAAGVINAASGTVNVTYSGDVQSPTQANTTMSTGTDYWAFPSTYTGGIVSNAPDTLNHDVISFSAGDTVTDKVTFSSPVVNPILAIVSLNAANLSVSGPLTVLATGPGHFGNGSLKVLGGNMLVPTGEGNGIVELSGTFSSFTFVHTAPEFWAGFTLGIQDVAGPASGVPEPGTAVLLGCGLAAACLLRKRIRRA